MAEVTIGDKNVTLTVEQLRQRYNLDDIASTKLTVSQINGVLNETNAELSDFVTQVTGDIADLQEQVDGTITSWFYEGEPTLENLPASEWSEIDYESHRGDLYYDQATGYAYRFSYVDSVFSWIRLSDTDATLALSIANEAKDTADSKRRVFVTTPTPPYDMGDLWVGTDTSDLKRCQAPKTDAESYDSADWIKAVKYTDDSTFDIVISKINESEEVETIDNEKLSTITADKIALEGYTTINEGFSVDLTGNMTATNADVAGKITSNEGVIGGWNISSSGIANGSTNATAKGILSGDTIAFYAGHLTPSSAPFRVTQAGSLVANNATISGTINSSAINSNYFDVTSSGVLKYYKSPGFLRCGDPTDHPYVSALNVAGTSTQGISFRSSTDRTSAGDPVGHVSMNTTGVMYIEADNNINIKAGASIGIDVGSGDYIRLSTVKVNGDTGAFEGAGGAYHYSNSNCMLNPASGYYAYVNTTSSSNRISVQDGTHPSSRNLKTNIQSLENNYENIYKDIQKMNTYSFDYKYKNLGLDDGNYGFIIDELETLPEISKIIKNYDKKGYIDGDCLLVERENDEGQKSLEAIDYKTWDRDSYIKMQLILIKSLQEKIDTLENRIKKLERGE